MDISFPQTEFTKREVSTIERIADRIVEDIVDSIGPEKSAIRHQVSGAWSTIECLFCGNKYSNHGYVSFLKLVIAKVERLIGQDDVEEILSILKNLQGKNY